MKICMLTMGIPSPYEPGKFAFVDQLACAWADLGNKVTVICPVPAFVEIINKKRFYKSEWTRYTVQGNTVSIVSPRYFSLAERKILGIHTQGISYMSYQKAVEHAILRLTDKPDILYGHFLPCGCHVGDIGKKIGTPSFCAFGESTMWSIDGWDIKKVKDSLSKLSGIISVSSENRRILINMGLFREEDIKVFPNGADHTLFHIMNKQEIRKRHGYEDNAFIGAFTGTFNDDKGVLRAQEAALRAGGIQMIYIGGGKKEPEGKNILFKGKLQHDSIPEYLNAADFFILPTKAEGCCNAIVEAMACGLPIISADGAYNDDILSDEYSIRTNPMDIDAMVDAIKALKEDPNRRKKMAIAASNASMKFDITERAIAITDFMKRKIKM